MKRPETTSQNQEALLVSIEQGEIVIPKFQRNFVWDVEDAASLIDSIVKGYPIGTFIFWETKDHLRSVRELGGFEFPRASEGERVSYVIDGQQRLTSLYLALKGLKETYEDADGEKHCWDFDEIFVDLKQAEMNGDVVIHVPESNPEEQEESALMPLIDLMRGGVKVRERFLEYDQTISRIRDNIIGYPFPIIKISGVKLDVATEIFSRVNRGGIPLTTFEIMVARTFDQESEFDLDIEHEELVESLNEADYGEIISEKNKNVVLQVVAFILERDCKSATILKIDKVEFIEAWPKAVQCIKKSVEYFRQSLNIPISKILPYASLVVSFSYFFYLLGDKKPTRKQLDFLEDFFWMRSLGERYSYSSSTEGKLFSDKRRMKSISKGIKPKYDWKLNLSPDYLADFGFSTSRGFVKAFLCLLASLEPKSFESNESVNLRNDWLLQANSKNYHHFFPKAYLEGRGWYYYANNMLNITIVDDYLNKREIGAKPPSKYMAKFEKNNLQLSKTMKTHLIGNLDKFGVRDNDYDKFIIERAKYLGRELKKRIISYDGS